MARPSDATTSARIHSIVASSTLKFVEAKYVEGRCADEIVGYSLGHVFLPSDDFFLIRQDRTIKWYPAQGIIERDPLPADKIGGLPGYRLIMAEQVRSRRITLGEHTSYLGLFKGMSDSVVARFDVINGRPSREADILLRSRLPITSIDFLGAPDTPEGSIGLVQRVRKGEAWLYSYHWDHGDLPQLSL